MQVGPGPNATMFRGFIAPTAYRQGPTLLAEPADSYDLLDGDEAVLIGGETALSVVEGDLHAGLDGAGIAVVETVDPVTSCTREEIANRCEAVRAAGGDIVIGVGGGVAMDVATAVADETDTELVAVPTIASTDAPTSTVSVVYDEAGNFLDVRHRGRNPELVLVDTGRIAAAPPRFLSHGMGDAIATRFEAEAVMRSNGTTVAGGASSHTAGELARLAYERVAEYGTAALAACERDAVTPAFEHVVEANTLLSGLGFESAGTAGAHAVQIGLTNAGVRAPHGVLVAFGTIVELILEDRPPETIQTVLELERSLGLDRTLDEFGLEEGAIEHVAAVALENGMADEPVVATEATVADAIRTADALVAD